MGRRQEGASVIYSVDKAMSLLEHLLTRRQPMTLLELSETSGYPKSTTYAMLSTMREHGMIEQRADGRYYLGIRLFECGCAVSSAWDISAVAHSYLEKLSSLTDASAYLSRIEGGDVVTFDFSAPNSGLQVVPEIGCRLPLHATSQGKLLLSRLSSDAVLQRLNQTGTLAYTPHTITDIPALMDELRKIREQGYSVEDGEYKVGLRSICAPVYDHNGSVRYALGVVGLFRRVHSDDFQNAIEQTLLQAKQLSTALGYRL